MQTVNIKRILYLFYSIHKLHKFIKGNYIQYYLHTKYIFFNVTLGSGP